MNFWRDYCQNTSLHGFPDLYNSKTTGLKLLWAFLIVAAMGGVGYEIYQVFRDFMDSPLITSYDIKSATTLAFPVIQICPYNYLSMEKARYARLHPATVTWAKTFVHNMLEVTFNSYVDPQTDGKWTDASLTELQMIVIMNPTKSAALGDLRTLIAAKRKIDAKSVPDEEFETLYKQSYIQALLSHKTFQNESLDGFAFDPGNATAFFPTETDHEALLNDLYPRKSGAGVPNVPIRLPEYFDLFGVNAEDRLFTCMFAGVSLNCSDLFETVFDENRGRCFLLKQKLAQPGEGLGMSLLLDLKTEDAWAEDPTVADGVEVRVMSDYQPLASSGLSVPAGAIGQITLHGTYNKLESGSVGACIADVERVFYNKKVPYSNTMCRSQCYQKVSLEECGCLGLIRKDFLLDAYQSSEFCIRGSQIACQMRLLTSGEVTLKAGECAKKCKPACEYWDYGPVITYSRMPSGGLRKKLVEFGAREGYSNLTNSLEARMRDNFIILQIAFERMQYKVISQKKSMTANGLLSQVGGQLGLFTGASLLSIAQILVYLWAALCGSLHRGGAYGSPSIDRIFPPSAQTPKKRKKPNSSSRQSSASTINVNIYDDMESSTDVPPPAY